MPEAIEGKLTPRLRPLSSVLDKWIETNTYVAKVLYPDDAPWTWWYNERALFSILAASVWQAGGIAFEEFSTEKRSKKETKHRRLYSGRQDLFFQVGRSMFVCEGKACWSGATSASTQPQARINRLLDRACAEVRATQDVIGRRLGVVFARPYIRQRKDGSVEDHIVDWLEKVKQVEHSCCAWVFPSRGRNFRDSRNYLPGIAVFIREV